MNKSTTLLASFSIATLISLIASCSPAYNTNGERIFFAANSSSGKPIYAQGFTMMQGSIACANCHGPNGHGGKATIMMTSFEAANITWNVLTGPYEDHQPYNETTLKDAITKGIDPNGKKLEDPMPEWQMADEDFNDLLGFLRTLK